MEISLSTCFICRKSRLFSRALVISYRGEKNALKSHIITAPVIFPRIETQAISTVLRDEEKRNKDHCFRDFWFLRSINRCRIPF